MGLLSSLLSSLLSTSSSSDIGNTDGYKEGVHFSKDKNGNIHETKWYGNRSASYRSSVDHHPDGSTSGEHTTKNRGSK